MTTAARTFGRTVSPQTSPRDAVVRDVGWNAGWQLYGTNAFCSSAIAPLTVGVTTIAGQVSEEAAALLRQRTALEERQRR
mmetsp:Transcript_8770/g.35835  ORF Transcript_8770/g.35835 Transcript_8770/m.35835 type:complete len:80 (+) Transcript_8770:158-397(+)